MALSEQQILQYSRQILLKEIGGQNQELWLTMQVRLLGEADAVLIAGAYLAASGLRVRSDAKKNKWVSLIEAASSAEVSEEGGVLSAMPSHFEGLSPWVGLGGFEQRAAVIYRTKKGCTGCFNENIDRISQPPPSDVSATQLGAIAALAFQRALLEIPPVVGGLWIYSEGNLERMEMKRCPECA